MTSPILMIAGLVFGVGCGLAAPSLRIAGNMTTIELAPVLIAANGLYRGQVTVINGGIPELMRGEVDAATNAETQLLRRSIDDPSLRIIFTEAESFYRVVARRSAGIKSVGDLRGKKIAVAPNTSAHYYLVKSLAVAGVKEDAITAVPVNPITGMSGMLANREVDAVAIWEPEAENSARVLGADAIVFQDRGLYREHFNLQTSTKVLSNPEKRSALVAFLRSLMGASAGLRERPMEFWPLLSSKLNYTEAVIARSWPQLRYAGSMGGDLLDVMVEEDRWVAKGKARAPRTREQLSVLIDRSLLAEARRGSAK
ncbi:MAG TPA: ABC transporter substrate-binding protein [Bryobacteraceae bacterium]|nr:ABC transporter substrate-binding protein [Bryobacteraceae bacterium]